ncbi:MAG: ChbG/HpnK family deacetylase [Oscillospiraceae bacterium]|jgi:predicted glycoside hydrolase/deacetylase ChbG (UPF0249 family)|nr:ChbG/HpnK family deacetylase [Oscillospiraceae bacterium]
MIKLIARSDDAGSSRSANKAIESVVKAGIIKNVSLMAPGPFIEEFAASCKDAPNVIFGMHATLNAEWDRVKWKPLTRASDRLVDADGFFLPEPKLFLETKPSIDEIIAEYDAQYEKLTALGFAIRYMDSHMMPELFIPGLFDAAGDFAKRRGIINHVYYYDLPDEDFMKNPKKYDGRQLFIVTHPSLNTREMRAVGNSQFKGEDVAKSRAKETRMLTSPLTKWFLIRNGIKTITYEQAVPGSDRYVREKAQYEGAR